MRSRHLSRVIATPPHVVYAYAAEPDHLPDWAAGLARSAVRREGDDLIVDSPMGSVRVRFVAPNALGVLDHEVVLPGGESVWNPVRVLPHPAGAEVVFTVRQRNMTDAQFDEDCLAVERDLEQLARILER
ncbi:SRPBCC family protein [Microbacterium sp. CBS5P-1]|nr:SRPBCC family protein [Microbacterium excoecariae]